MSEQIVMCLAVEGPTAREEMVYFLRRVASRMKQGGLLSRFRLSVELPGTGAALEAPLPELVPVQAPEDVETEKTGTLGEIETLSRQELYERLRSLTLTTPLEQLLAVVDVDEPKNKRGNEKVYRLYGPQVATLELAARAVQETAEQTQGAPVRVARVKRYGSRLAIDITQCAA